MGPRLQGGNLGDRSAEAPRGTPDPNRGDGQQYNTDSNRDTDRRAAVRPILEGEDRMVAQFYSEPTNIGIYILAWFVGWVLVGGFVASAIWKNKGGSGGDGFLMGALLGILGIILAAVMTPKRVQVQQATMLRECPFCKQQIRRDASVCAF